MTDRTRRRGAPGRRRTAGRGRWGEGGPDAPGVGRPGEAEPPLLTDGGARERTLFGVTPDPAVAYALEDGVPVVVDANPAYRARFDVDADVAGALGARLETDLVVTSVDGPERLDGVDDLVDRAAAGVDFRGTVAAPTPTGERHYLARVVPIDAAGGSAGAAGGEAAGEAAAEAAAAADGDRATREDGYVVLADVTPQVERTREVVAQRDRLDEFASMVSHDLRNPLEVAGIHLEAARDRGDDVHFETVRESHDRIDTIVEDVLSLARQGAVIDEAEAVSLSSVAEAAWSTVSAPGASLTVEADAVVEADGDRLRELLENLFRNARDHGGPDVSVTVGPTADGFYVVDDGPGIPGDELESVFEGGFSTRGGGTGLGLAIVRRIVEAHGWTITATDGASGGARFEVGGVETDGGEDEADGGEDEAVGSGDEVDGPAAEDDERDVDD